MWFRSERHFCVFGVVVENVIFRFARVQKSELTVRAVMNDDFVLHTFVIADLARSIQ